MEERLTAAGGELLAGIAGGVATVTLNRPAALNALSYAMIEGLAAWLEAWARDPRVESIELRGAGEKAFCAGGDVRALHDGFQAKAPHLLDYFAIEYALDHRIHHYAKPVTAFLDGIVMGGGMGISQGARRRIVGPKTKMAMPETAIGLFPDVGGGWFLARTPGRVGEYLALVGPTLGAADAIYAGLADEYLGPEPRPESGLARLQPAIDRHFAQSTVSAILQSLGEERDPALQPWTKTCIEKLERHSPTMLVVTLEQVRRAREMTLADDLRMELGLVHACFEQGDFIEGIRALIVDKDGRPRWNPARLADVPRDTVAKFFAPRWSPDTHPLRHLEG